MKHCECLLCLICTVLLNRKIEKKNGNKTNIVCCFIHNLVDLCTLCESTSDKSRFHDMIMFQECDTLV